MDAKKILIIGPMAPPFGGVSIHLQRLIQLLKDRFIFDFIDESRITKKEYFNIRSFNFFTYIKKIRNADIVYINSGKRSLRIFHLLSGSLFSKKMIINIHSFTSNSSKFICYINGIIYRLANTIIVVNSDLKKRLFLPKTKCIIQDAFIPPVIEEEPELPESLHDLLVKKNKTDTPLICANASRLDTYNNQDLYGLDLCIEVTKRLLKKNIKIIFIFVVGTTEVYKNTYSKSIELIKELNLQNHFHLINEKLSFIKLIERSDIVLRPTNTDGDSVTIREALYLNKTVLASDVVKRPYGVCLFKNRDIDDLEINLEKIIKQFPQNNRYKNSRAEIKPDLKKIFLDLFENFSVN